MVTAWDLGTGPCGTRCPVHDVGIVRQITRLKRFLNFTLSYSDTVTGEYNEKDITTFVENNCTSTILAINDHENWEQEILTAFFEVDSIKMDRPSLQ